MEQRNEVRTFRVDLLCEECGDIAHKVDQTELVRGGHLYTYQCRKMHWKGTTTVNYPKIEYEIIETE